MNHTVLIVSKIIFVSWFRNGVYTIILKRDEKLHVLE
jgi:hypothetical protein